VLREWISLKSSGYSWQWLVR